MGFSSIERRSASATNTKIRIFDNQHLLDATEIFRKLNVHKKVHIVNLLGVRAMLT